MNYEFVGGSFSPRDTQYILNIPICLVGGSDQLIWHFIPRGKFTAASTYKLGFKMLREMSASSFATVNDWSLIWSSNIPPKVRIFIW